MPAETPTWPINRKFPRFKLELPMKAHSEEHGVVAGMCLDVSEGGVCASFPASFQVGKQVRLELKLPGSSRAMYVVGLVRHTNSQRHGIEFVDLTPQERTRIRQFGSRLNSVAYLVSSHPATVRELQRRLQCMGVPHVFMGAPKKLPVPDPCLIVIDSEWPEYLEVTEFLRAEGGNPMVIVALLSPEADGKPAHQHGADLVVHKPVTSTNAQRVLTTAFNLLRRTHQ